ncbi:SDR family NAD(P)-dependent oxidoreductase [Bythopirellula polymerisocia]|uniref:3-oxoacyl-[acyl-carrier-protein] reductase FabG n=1 Tax=Bythopirellula polymerisocia TaxID=2528003 RepID=A0A5C6CLY4_9BACT|nr:glucose 1-dehydrogenase [Bythopirellula polymerisocia]TWU24567.1 3-oxoacyl-[acyl-carrier-protein] reductase FabG [Bythopirellula polymerisocia]
MSRLTSKKAIVTGGGQGLGRAIVEELMRQGCDVAIHYYKSAEGSQQVKQAAPPGIRAECFSADLTDESAASAMVSEAVKFLGGLEILVNNSGDIIARRRLGEVDFDFWRRVMDVNVMSMMFVTRQAVPHLQASKNSSVVNVASLAGRMGGHAGSLVYSTAKGAVLTWTRSLAKELGPQGVRVNAIAPGLILGTAFHATHTTPESASETVAGIPLGRAGNPADVARAVAFLASEFDGFITGATLDINGGVFGC